MKKSHIVILVVLVIALTIVISTMYDSNTYSDFNNAKKNPDKTFQIIGKLSRTEEIKFDTTIAQKPLSFFMTDDKGTECKVLYYGQKPCNFETLQQVVVTGKVEGNVFIASEMLLKCPSKYSGSKDDFTKFPIGNN